MEDLSQEDLNVVKDIMTKLNIISQIYYPKDGCPASFILIYAKTMSLSKFIEIAMKHGYLSVKYVKSEMDKIQKLA